MRIPLWVQLTFDCKNTILALAFNLTIQELDRMLSRKKRTLYDLDVKNQLQIVSDISV